MKSIVVGTRDYQSLLEPFGEVTHYYPELLNDLSGYDTIMFTGGADVESTRYGETPHPKSFFNTLRDGFEFDLFTHCKRRGMKFIGICRGAQLLCVANGDSLTQHLDGHTNKTHNIVTKNDGIVETIGDHHQMMRPEKGDVIAYSVDVATKYENGCERMSPYFDADRRIIEPEVVYYELTSSLCVQFHPEWANKDHASRKYFNKLVEEYIV